MFKLTLKILKKKRKDVLIIAIITFILSLISVFGFTVARDICNTKKQEGLKTYGSFIAGGTVETKEDVPVSDELKIGTFSEADSFRYKGSELSVAKADENFYELTSCKVIEGKIPDDEKEIAVQKFVLSLFDKQLGDNISLKVNGKTDDFVIVGVLNNYSMTLSTDVETKKSLYPAIVLSDEYETELGLISYLIGYQDPNMIGYNLVEESEKLGNLIGCDYVHYENYNLFSEGFRYCRELEAISNIFMIIIFAMAGIICFVVYRFFFKNLRRNFARFGALGGIKCLQRTVYIQMAFVSSVAFICSMAVYLAIASIIYGGNEAVLKSGMAVLGIWYASYTVLLIIFIKAYIYHISKFSIRENINCREIPRVQSWFLNKLNMVKNIVKYALVFVIIFFCIFFINTLKDTFEGIPDYQLLSQTAGVYEIRQGYRVNENTGFVYNIKDLDNIINKYHDVRYELTPDMTNNMPIVKADYKNNFLRNWYNGNRDEDTEVEGSKLLSDWPAEACDYYPINNADFIVLSGREYENICDYFGINNDKRGIFLYTPTVEDAGIDVSQLNFAGITVDETVQFEKYETNISYVLNKTNMDIITENINEYSYDLFRPENITFLFNYDELDNYPMINGYESVVIYLDDRIYDNADLENDLSAMQSGIIGGRLYSKGEDERKAESYNSYLEKTISIIIIICVVISVIYIYGSVILYIRNSRRRLGIMMVLGKNRTGIVAERAVKNLKEVFFATLTGAFIVTAVAFGVDNGLLCVQGGLLATLAVFILMIFDIIIFKNFLKKVKIKESIYNI